MMPGMNSRQMKQAMKKMGIKQEEVDAEEVIIRCKDKDIVISDPNVTKVNMSGQKTYQVMGEEEERSRDNTPDVSEDDINTVMKQADVSKEEAEKAIKEANYDLAEAVMSLQK